MLEMLPEPCRAWSLANGNKPIAILAASLVQRLEVFCLRLAASASGVGTRTRLLVAGWLPQVRYSGLESTRLDSLQEFSTRLCRM